MTEKETYPMLEWITKANIDYMLQPSKKNQVSKTKSQEHNS